MNGPEIEDLQYIIHKVKKENLDLRNENQLQKVKIRKLQDDVNKSSKQLDGILDPRKHHNIAHLLSRHAAQLITKLKDENFSLYKKLADKDVQIKKLQSELETTRLYINEKSRLISPSVKLFEQQELMEKLGELGKRRQYKSYTDRPAIRIRSKSVNHKKPRTRSVSPLGNVSKSTINTEKNYIEKINNNLQKIKQSGSFQGEKANPIISSKNDVPHEEIQQLQSYLINVLNEVDSLKNTINGIQRGQTDYPMVANNKYQSILKAEEVQRKPHLQLELEDTREYDSEMTETMSVDKESSKYSSYVSSGESDYTEMTEASTSDAKSSHQCPDQEPCFKSICVQTARSFCSHSFTPLPTLRTTCKKIGVEDEVLDEYDLEVEYIN